MYTLYEKTFVTRLKKIGGLLLNVCIINNNFIPFFWIYLAVRFIIMQNDENANDILTILE